MKLHVSMSALLDDGRMSEVIHSETYFEGQSTKLGNDIRKAMRFSMDEHGTSALDITVEVVP